MARIRIRIIFEGHFIQIFEYSNICAHHCVCEMPKQHFLKIFELFSTFKTLLNIQAIPKIVGLGSTMSKRKKIFLRLS